MLGCTWTIAGLRSMACALAFGVSLAPHANAADSLKIGAIFDLTGDLNIYGVQQMRGLRMAVAELNAGGGVITRRVEIIESDAQSEQAKYTQYANTLIMRDRVTALFAGLTSSAREAIRPIVRRSNTPYFYTSLYEGGACDKQTFVTGPSASQQLSVLVEWAIKAYGPRIYIMAPDYNFGTISASWVAHYAQKLGGSVVGTDLLPLTVTDFSSTIQKIQRAKPDFVVALPVGANQTGFIEQFSAAGLKDKVGLVSTNYGSGNQQVVVSPDSGKDIVAFPEYMMWVNNPQNDVFRKKWEMAYGTSEPIIGTAVDTYNAVLLWAKAVEKAGTADAAEVIEALESGLTLEAPNGPVTLLPQSHHLQMNIYVARGNTQRGFDIIETRPAVPPSFESEVCDLITKPKTAKHFTPPGL